MLRWYGKLFEATPSKVKGHPEISLPYKCTTATKFDRKNLCPKYTALLRVKGHAGVTQGQPEVKLLGNPQWPTNLETTTPTRGQLLRNAQGHQMWPMSLLNIMQLQVL